MSRRNLQLNNHKGLFVVVFIILCFHTVGASSSVVRGSSNRDKNKKLADEMARMQEELGGAFASNVTKDMKQMMEEKNGKVGRRLSHRSKEMSMSLSLTFSPSKVPSEVPSLSPSDSITPSMKPSESSNPSLPPSISTIPSMDPTMAPTPEPVCDIDVRTYLPHVGRSLTCVRMYFDVSVANYINILYYCISIQSSLSRRWILIVS